MGRIDKTISQRVGSRSPAMGAPNLGLRDLGRGIGESTFDVARELHRIEEKEKIGQENLDILNGNLGIDEELSRLTEDLQKVDTKDKTGHAASVLAVMRQRVDNIDNVAVRNRVRRHLDRNSRVYLGAVAAQATEQRARDYNSGLKSQRLKINSLISESPDWWENGFAGINAMVEAYKEMRENGIGSVFTKEGETLQAELDRNFFREAIKSRFDKDIASLTRQISENPNDMSLMRRSLGMVEAMRKRGKDGVSKEEADEVIDFFQRTRIKSMINHAAAAGDAFAAAELLEKNTELLTGAEELAVRKLIDAVTTRNREAGKRAKNLEEERMQRIVNNLMLNFEEPDLHTLQAQVDRRRSFSAAGPFARRNVGPGVVEHDPHLAQYIRRFQKTEGRIREATDGSKEMEEYAIGKFRARGENYIRGFLIDLQMRGESVSSTTYINLRDAGLISDSDAAKMATAAEKTNAARHDKEVALSLVMSALNAGIKPKDKPMAELVFGRMLDDLVSQGATRTSAISQLQLGPFRRFLSDMTVDYIAAGIGSSNPDHQAAASLLHNDLTSKNQLIGDALNGRFSPAENRTMRRYADLVPLGGMTDPQTREHFEAGLNPKVRNETSKRFLKNTQPLAEAGLQKWLSKNDVTRTRKIPEDKRRAGDSSVEVVQGEVTLDAKANVRATFMDARENAYLGGASHAESMKYALDTLNRTYGVMFGKMVRHAPSTVNSNPESVREEELAKHLIKLTKAGRISLPGMTIEDLNKIPDVIRHRFEGVPGAPSAAFFNGFGGEMAASDVESAELAHVIDLFPEKIVPAITSRPHKGSGQFGWLLAWKNDEGYEEVITVSAGTHPSRADLIVGDMPMFWDFSDIASDQATREAASAEAAKLDASADALAKRIPPMPLAEVSRPEEVGPLFGRLAPGRLLPKADR